MIKILLFAPYHDCKRYADEVFAEFGETDVILETIYAVGVKFMEKQHFNCDAIIARGVTASALQSAYRHIPVIDLPVTGYDMIHAIDQCKQRYNAKKIAVIGSDSMIYGVENVASVLDIDITCYPVEREEDAEHCVREVLAQAYDAVISGAMAVEIARSQGLNAVLVASGREAVFQAIQEAVRTARVAKQKQEEAVRIKAIMDYAYEGVVAIDEKGLITVFNRTAEHIMNVPAAAAIGRPIKEILPHTGLLRVLATGKEELSELQKINGIMVAKNRVPVKIKERVVGAVATFQNAVKIQELEGRIREKIYYKGLTAKYSFQDIVGSSQAICETVAMTKKYSKVDSNILLSGETGTGKELMAQSCHNQSERRRGPFVAVNCAALPENLLESEFFGYVQGAFTGAARSGKPGLFELAHQGTIFLDEVSEIPLKLQGRLLRVLQEREIMRLGDDRVIPVNVRVISATNKDLKQLAAQGDFRLDLLYRLDVLHLRIPPLRERKGDISVLFNHFIAIYNNKFSKDIQQLAPDAAVLLNEYAWPGNVRELGNICERLAVLAEGPVILKKDVLKVLDLAAKPVRAGQPGRDKTAPKAAGVDKAAIQRALLEAGGNKTKAAEALGVSRTTLWRKLTE